MLHSGLVVLVVVVVVPCFCALLFLSPVPNKLKHDTVCLCCLITVHVYLSESIKTEESVVMRNQAGSLVPSLVVSPPASVADVLMILPTISLRLVSGGR